jgi:hypothetical protein
MQSDSGTMFLGSIRFLGCCLSHSSKEYCDHHCSHVMICYNRKASPLVIERSHAQNKLLEDCREHLEQILEAKSDLHALLDALSDLESHRSRMDPDNKACASM